IAQGKSKGYVFATTDEMNTWMEDQENVAKLSIGDNLYIVDKHVMDYWWDGTNLRVLETELPDMSNVVTTLGAATGGGNAITDISIDGNTLTLAKNNSFVTNNYDETIIGQKTFNTTIHSVGIMVQTYDNNSVVCAGGGVKAISDISANYYNKSESYSQTETNNRLNNKANAVVSYAKGEDDALLLLKDDKTQLIDSYTKGETNNLLNNKADTGVSYSQGEDDALLLLKADKTQLIDSYSKSVSYSKSDDDTLLLAKADKTQMIDSYTKGETNNLLNNKADSGVSYTKGEDDALLLLKANQSTTYTKTETDYLISQIDVGDVDQTDYYNKTKTDELLSEKADATELSNYVTLGTSQTITANKTFNNSCRFVSSIDGMSTVTGASFVKTCADDTVILLGAGGTKPISEFVSAPTDLSNYYTKPQTYAKEEVYSRNDTYSQTQTNSLINNKVSDNIPGNDSFNGSAGMLSLFARADHKHILNVAPSTDIQPCINGVASKGSSDYYSRHDHVHPQQTTYNQNLTATGFVKTDKDDTPVLLAGGGDQLLSSFGGVQVEDITDLILNLHSNIIFNYLNFVRIDTFYTLMMEIILKTQISISTSTTICSIGNSSSGISPPTPPSTTYPIQLATNRKTLTCIHSYRYIRITTDSTQAGGINDDVGLQFSWML
ncbi:MAG: hypothetical protein EZS28_034868, partial [Streblomastix strix]